MENKVTKAEKKDLNNSTYLAEGMCMGMSFGCVAGAAHIMNMGVAIGLGMLLGLVAGMLIKKE